MVRREPVTDVEVIESVPSARSLAATALCAPIAMAALYVAILVAGGLLNLGPLRPEPYQNLAEAAAGRDAATALRRIREGYDPNRQYLVSAGRLSEVPWTGAKELLPLEAAALTGDDVMVALLQREGAVLDAAEALRIACLSSSRGRTEIAKMIAGALWDADRCVEAANQRGARP